jgi:hypothetical protein
MDYYQSGKTIAAAPRFNQAATIRADFFRPDLKLILRSPANRTKEETPPT